MHGLIKVLVVIFSCLTVVDRLDAQETSTPAPIVLGTSSALSGPTKFLGRNSSQGMQLAIARANAESGIQGRPLQLLVLDDAYEPARTAVNVRALIDQHQVVAVVGNVGTPTAMATVAICQQAKVVFFAPMTGTTMLRQNPPDPLLFHVRASYADEAKAIIEALLGPGQLQPHQLAVFSQRDAFGDSGYAAIRQAINRFTGEKKPHLLHVRYERNTLAVEAALANILTQPQLPRVVITIGTYGPTAKFIRLAHQAGVDALFISLSFAGGDPLAYELRDVNAKVMVMQVVPPPHESDLPIVHEYHQDMQRLAPNHWPSFASMEGYILMRTLIDAMRSSGLPITRPNMVSILQQGQTSIDLGQGALRFSEQVHEASHQVWPTLLHNGRFVSTPWQSIQHLLPEPIQP